MKIRKKYLVLTFLIMIFIGFSFSQYLDNPSKVYAESDRKALSVDKNLVIANTRFALNIFKELQKEDVSKNIFISPLSISLALSMTYNGANASTKEAMAETLQIKDFSLQEVNEGFKNLIESLLTVDDQVSLNIGNSVWIRKNFESAVKTGFKESLMTYYSSEIYSRQFSDPKTIDEINGWVNNETNGKIDKIIDEIDGEIVMFLLNAIYFKGDWIKKFDESKTSQNVFYLQNNETVNAELMHNIEKYFYYLDDNVQVARLPYGRDKIAMYVFLPKEGINLDDYTESLDQQTLEDIFSGMTLTELELTLPKFKVEYGKKALKDVLTKLGMGIAFDRAQANLEGIASVESENLFISFVDHKAVIEVNEKGTEAAAVTNVGIGLTSIPMRTKFTVNRPHLLMIRDDRSGSILFMGKITDPTQSVSP
ncbi:serpin family protein [Candidatus Bathyarchaeota archaeon]|nr:serpin family protein [Candidatus Bathyarchaeota archaeon]